MDASKKAAFRGPKKHSNPLISPENLWPRRGSEMNTE
jgi:hypothetical protein